MKFSPFRGGVHPDGYKELSAHQAIEKLPLPDRLYVPLRQHAGSEALAIVQPGDFVMKGQLIGRAAKGISAPVHAPTSGKVLKVQPFVAAHPSGMDSNTVIIECDGNDTPIATPTNIDPFSLDGKTLSDTIANAGIVGMGGASFPAAVKLSSASRQVVNTVIINGGECEPYLTADDRLMRERPEQIILGARLIRHIVNAENVCIAIEDNKKEAISALRQASSEYRNIQVIVVPTLYPMGSAKQMIQAVTGKEVPAGGRSSDIGVLMHNVATTYAIAQCLSQNEPLVSRIVTVSGGAIKHPKNIEALVGTPIKQLIDFCGGTLEEPSKLLLGGPMMGQLMPSDEVPLIKGAAGVLALNNNEISQPSASPCIRCGRCVSACPMGLVPLEMANHSRQQDFDGAIGFGLKDCILCGSCAFVCPSHIPLVHYFQYAKGEVAYQKATQQRMDHTRQLSESRRARQEKEAAEKAAAKAAAKAAKEAKAAAKRKKQNAASANQ